MNQKSIYDSSLKNSLYDIMSEAQSIKTTVQLKTLGEKLEELVQSYEPNNKANPKIFSAAQTIALAMMTYVAKATTLLSHEIIFFVDDGRFGNPAGIAHTLSIDAEKNGASQKKYLLSVFDLVKKYYPKTDENSTG